MKRQGILLYLLISLCTGCYAKNDTATGKGKVTPLTQSDIKTTDALPRGMKLVWNDEFNGNQLDTTKWFTNYYSILDYVYKTNFEDFEINNLPQPEIEFTGKSIILKVDEKKPERAFWENGRKVSSIQTYDWNSDRNKMDNSLGGYFETRIRRNASDSAKNVNVAFWFDSPGPDPRYFMEKGNHALGIEGIRPHGQVFEIDLCEYITTEIVLHGNVSSKGEFERNIGHHIERGDFKDQWITHSMLWTPAGLKFYIDGKLVKEWWDPNDIKSPNHMMNMFFGAYGNDGIVTMEVDYIRYYQWELEDNNLLPNGNFEYSENLFPWEGTGNVNHSSAYKGDLGVTLIPGDSITQYVYLEHSKPFSLSYHGRGEGNISAQVENLTQVTGMSENIVRSIVNLESEFKKYQIDFGTNPEYGTHKRTVRITFKNIGDKPVMLDTISIEKK